MSTRTRWLVGAIAVAITGALALWVSRSIEWVDVTIPLPSKGEAARDDFYAAKQLARRLGATVTTLHSFDQLPPPGATLVLASQHWAMFPGRDAALQRWVRDGGRLVVLQSAWSAERKPPPWVPIRSSRPPRPGKAASDPSSSESEPASTVEISPLVFKNCKRYVEPDGGDGAFGAPRDYRVCGWPSAVLRGKAPSWQIAGDEGAVAMRVPLDRGDVTSNALEDSFSNAALLHDDGALAFVAMLQLAAGDRVWFLVDETRTPFMALLWEHGAPAIVLALAALALLLWRGGVRFGPRLIDAPIARRSIGEQVRRTAAFVARGGGAALHTASIRALEEQARRSIANYSGLVGRRDRSDAIANKTGTDPATLAAAMAPIAQPNRKSIAAAIHRLERARRTLAAGARHPLHRPASDDATAP